MTIRTLNYQCSRFSAGVISHAGEAPDGRRSSAHRLRSADVPPPGTKPDIGTSGYWERPARHLRPFPKWPQSVAAYRSDCLPQTTDQVHMVRHAGEQASWSGTGQTKVRQFLREVLRPVPHPCRPQRMHERNVACRWAVTRHRSCHG